LFLLIFSVIQNPITGVFAVLFIGSGGVLWYIVVCKSVAWEGMNCYDYLMEDMLSFCCCCNRTGFTPVDSNDNSRVFEETELYDM